MASAKRKSNDTAGNNGPSGVEGPSGISFQSYLAESLNKRHEVNRTKPKQEGHVPLGREEFERMMKLAGVKESDLKTTDGILEAERKIMEKFEAPKGPFVERKEDPGKRYGKKVEPKIEEVDILKEQEPKVVHMLKEMFRGILPWPFSK